MAPVRERAPRVASVLFATVAVCAVCYVPAAGDLIAWDDFESYSPGGLNNGAGGDGWSGNWSAAAAASVVASGIPARGQSMQILPPSGNSLAERSFPQQTGDVYVGMELHTANIGSSNFLQVYVNASSGESWDSGVSGGIRNTSANPYFARIDGWENSTNSSTAFHVNDQMGLLVLRFSRSGSKYERTDVFVDQPTEGAPDATHTTGDSGTSGLSRIHFRTYGLDADDLILIDSLRIATDYAHAVPGPLPVALLLLGAPALARRRRPR